MPLKPSDIAEFKANFFPKSTDELIQLLRENAMDGFCPEAVEAIRQLLKERRAEDSQMDSIRKKCPGCGGACHLAASACDCGFEFMAGPGSVPGPHAAAIPPDRPAPQPACVRTEEGLTIRRRSGWSAWFAVLGGLQILGGLLLLFNGQIGMRGDFSGVVLAVLLMLGGIHTLFIAFLVNVLTDIRWFLRPEASR